MRTLLIGALAATLIGCSCLLPPQAGMESCADANGSACFHRTAAGQPIEPRPASFQTDSATIEMKSAIAAKSEKPSSAPDGYRAHLAMKSAKPTMIAAIIEPSAVLRGDAEKTAPASPNELPAASAQNQWADTAWVVSETTSPVDYSPLITAEIHAASDVKDAPNTLAVRCSGPRTELLLRTEGAWRPSRASEVQVDYQINDQPVVRLQWTVSTDGTPARYKDDAIEVLRSLPEGARLKTSVLDSWGLGQEATFKLTGLDSVRKKIALACKWPSPAETMSSRKR
jgi:Type VI secretion system VasI, EvfG, VC_A0118